MLVREKSIPRIPFRAPYRHDHTGNSDFRNLRRTLVVDWPGDVVFTFVFLYAVQQPPQGASLFGFSQYIVVTLLKSNFCAPSRMSSHEDVRK